MKIIKPYRFLPKENIEAQANKILQEIQGTKFFRPGPLDTTLVAEFLDLDVEWFKLPQNPGETVAAIILPIQRRIVIDDQVLSHNQGFIESTIAHEIGHWILHINQNSVEKYIDKINQGIEIKIDPFLCRNSQQGTGIEWQAQYFASCLLMPKSKLEQARQGRNLTNWNHLYAIRDELGVTISNLLHRLKGLGWIYIPPGSKQIYYPHNKERVG